MFPKFIQVGLYLGDVCIGGLAFRMLIGLHIWGAYKREHIYGTLRYLLMNRQLVFHEFVFSANNIQIFILYIIAVEKRYFFQP